MSVKYELVGVIGEENYPVSSQTMVDGKLYSGTSEERKVPMVFKDLPVGTQLFIKKVEVDNYWDDDDGSISPAGIHGDW